ncbi:hypothetical protein [Sulfurimonas sp.]|uniref:hypothetical protein n=1 Tax=Sulfurimonas sp. TaxID=2022749 RepID=UPI00262825E6|nr:hypothetical protein [Sulfurimonas sp.]MDD3855999.1 hypothetical protein [Sulfurimonas sp.]
MGEIDWDAPDEAVVDFEDLEQTDKNIPFKKESMIAKPKTGFNINFRDLEDVVSALTAAEMQLQNNLGELKKLDNLASRAKILSELDTSKILEQLEKVGFTQIARKITDNLKSELETQKKEIYTSSSALETATKDLNKKAENLIIVADGFKNLDNMADDLQDFTKSVNRWRNKSMFIALGLSLFFGLSSGVFVSNINSIFAAESIQNAQILKSKFGEIVALQDEQNPKLYYLAIPEHQKIKEVVSFVQDNTRYIKIEAK